MIQKTYHSLGSIRIVLVGDLHIGVKGFREDILQDIISEIKKPNTYWIGLGDFVEGREPGHKFFDNDEVEMCVGDQYKAFFAYMRPYSKKCLGIVRGNHEENLIRKTTIDNLSMFCADNGITYFGDLGRLVITNDKQTCTFLIHHGAGGGIKVGSSLNKAVDFAKSYQAEVITIGHYHKLAHYISSTGYVNKELMQRWKPCHVILNGSCFEGFKDGSIGSYAERMMCSPNALGYAIVTLDKDLEPQVVLKPY